MARNIEIKARVDDLAALRLRARAIAEGPSRTLLQDDTFFACPQGRLKLRCFAEGAMAELIHYHRADAQGPKLSDYLIVPVPAAHADLLREALSRACGPAGRVRKRRELLMVGATRIHLDTVEGLGDFVELEVVLHDGQSEADGLATAHRVMADLGIAGAQLVAGAYVDLLRAQGRP